MSPRDNFEEQAQRLLQQRTSMLEDEILSFESRPPVTSLNDFLQTYLTIKEETRKSGKSYSIEVWRPSASRLETIQVAPPPSLPSLF